MIVNILLVILVLYAVFAPYFFIKFGLKLAEKPEKTADEPMFNIKLPKPKPKMTAEEDRMNQILRNIDNYNGSSVGQVKVEVKHD